MSRTPERGLTERESQIMQVLWRRRKAGVETVQADLPDELVDSTVRTTLSVMQRKGYVAVHKEGRANVYSPLLTQPEAGRSAVSRVIDRFYGGSPSMLLAQLAGDDQVSLDDLDRLRELLKQ